MTDREALLALLDRFGLAPMSEEMLEPNDEAKLSKDPNAVTLQAMFGGVGGYDGFVADFEFDEAGKFTALKLWE